MFGISSLILAFMAVGALLVYESFMRAINQEHRKLLQGELLYDGAVGLGVFRECEPTHRLRTPARLALPEPARSGLHR